MKVSGFKLRLTAHHLHCGGIISYPTESVYGLGCDPLNEAAVSNLLLLKHRPKAKGLILIASHLDQVRPYITEDNVILERIQSAWPGPVTWVIPVQPWVPDWLTGNHNSLAIRVTAHPVAKALCEIWGHPLISTSANIAGKQPAINALMAKKYFPGPEIHIIHGKTGGLSQTTSIYDAVDGRRLR